MTPAEREAWLVARRKGIGSSDAAACCGLSPWGTPLHVYRDKVGLSLAQSSWEMGQGLALEPIVAALYTQETGRELTDGKHTQHPSIPWMLASPDRLAKDRIVELKTTGFMDRGEDGWGDPGTDQVPPVYMCQVQHQMLTTGIDLCDIAVMVGQDIRIVDLPTGPMMIGVKAFHVYTIPFSREFCELMFVAEEAVWSMVERRREPEPDWQHPATIDLMTRYKPVTGKVCELSGETGVLAAQYRAMGQFIRDGQKWMEEAKAKLIGEMGDAETALLPCGYRIERKLVKRGGYEVKPSEYYTLSVKEPKNVECIS